MNAQAQAQNRNSADQEAEGFFDLHVNMIGYLSRVRWVQPSNKRQGGRKSEPFLSCCIAALHGPKGSANYTYFDLRVSGDEAIELVSQLEEASNSRSTILVSAKVGDIYPHIYERDVKDDNGRKTGDRETAALIKGRLLILNSVKIDGELFYKRAAQEQGDQGTDGASEDQAHGQHAMDSSFGEDEGTGSDHVDAQQEQRQDRPFQRQSRPAHAESANSAPRRPSTGTRQGGYRSSGYARA